jgi:serine protease Do
VISSKKVDQSSGVGVGSGVIFQRNGNSVYILTNNHVVEGATQFEIVTALGEHKKASLVGKDLISDLAVLEASGDGVKAIAEFGNSDTLKAGEFAIAVGNPLGLGYSPTVTLGIISIPKRTIPVSLTQGGENDWEMDVIQTDAAINQGNSGGPLVNIDGQVIGINSLKISDTGVEGLGFAIPINAAKPIIESLISNHKVKRPMMGVSTQELQSFKGTEVLKLPAEVKSGVIVFEVSGPAKDAGIQSQDVIVQLDSRKIATTIALRKYLYYEKKIGDQVIVTFYRGGKKMNTTLMLTEAVDK